MQPAAIKHNRGFSAGDDETPPHRGASRAERGDRTEFASHQILALDLLLRRRMRHTPTPHTRRSAHTTVGRTAISRLGMVREGVEGLERAAVPTHLGPQRRIGARCGERRQRRCRERRASRVRGHHVVPILSAGGGTRVAGVPKDCSWAISLVKKRTKRRSIHTQYIVGTTMITRFLQQPNLKYPVTRLFHPGRPIIHRHSNRQCLLLRIHAYLLFIHCITDIHPDRYTSRFRQVESRCFQIAHSTMETQPGHRCRHRRRDQESPPEHH